MEFVWSNPSFYRFTLSPPFATPEILSGLDGAPRSISPLFAPLLTLAAPFTSPLAAPLFSPKPFSCLIPAPRGTSPLAAHGLLHLYSRLNPSFEPPVDDEGFSWSYSRKWHGIPAKPLNTLSNSPTVPC